jgi:hypothetical protein
MVLPVCIAAQAPLKRRPLGIIYEWMSRYTYAATSTANVKGLAFREQKLDRGSARTSMRAKSFKFN